MKTKFHILTVATLLAAVFVSIVSVSSAAWVTNEARGPIINSSNDCGYLCWSGANWSALYCDINNAASYTELLYYENIEGSDNPEIGGTGCVIDKGELVYSTAPYSKKYKASSKGGATEVDSYFLIPWMCKKYVAVEGDARKITPLVIEQGSSAVETLKVGESWELGNNYSLICNQVDVDGGKVWLSLYKEGVELESEILGTDTADSRTFVAKGDFADMDDAVYFVTYVDNVFNSATDSIVRLKYTWLIDKDNVTIIEMDDKFGEMECTEASENLIKLSNANRMELKIDGDTYFTDDMYIKTSALMPRSGRISKIRYYFYPAKSYSTPGETYELRGEVFNTSLGEPLFWDNSLWNVFYFSIKGPEDSLKYSETLYYQNIDESAHAAINDTSPGSNVIDEGELVYSTTTYYKTYRVKSDHYSEVQKVETYPALHWMCKLYVAIGGDAQKITPLVCEQRAGEEKVLNVGESWDLGKNYSLICNQLDVDGGKVWLSLSKDGVELESEVLDVNTNDADDGIFVATADFAGKTDVIYFVTYVDKAFKSNSDSFVKLMATWLIDKDDITTIKNGDKFGEMECTVASESSIRLSNENSITLELDDKTYFMDDMYFTTSEAHEDGGFSIYPAKEVTVSSGGAGRSGGAWVQDSAENSTIVKVDLAPLYKDRDPEAIENESAGQTGDAEKSPGFGVISPILGLLSVLFLSRKINL